VRLCGPAAVASPAPGSAWRETPSDVVYDTADHCYACTAGQGSSCGGALDD